MILYINSFNTELGEMTAIASKEKLYLLQFSDSLSNLNNYLNNFTSYNLEHKPSKIISLCKGELADYFSAKLKKFTVPIEITGTEFEKNIYNCLLKIPYGQISSYSQIATQANNIQAYRAVANTNAKNKIVIIIPCHRVIASNGKLAGYNGGLDRKKFLLNLEMNNVIAIP